MPSANALKPLRRQLDRLYSTFDIAFLETDPLLFVHRYKRPEDREIVALISSSLAYGRVDGIKRSVEKVLKVIGPSPRAFTQSFSPVSGKRLFDGFVHRFNTGGDVTCLIWYARRMIEEEGSIKGYFLKGYSALHKNVKEALAAFSSGVLSMDASPVYGVKRLPKDAGVRFFFPNPLDGSPCKRLNLFLRWMVRRGDSLDFGQWEEVSPSKLVIPLDTHVARISRNIGLTRRANADWRMAEEVTDALKKLDPDDPVKYDFALCRLGILDKCPKGRDASLCERCLIKKVCIL